MEVSLGRVVGSKIRNGETIPTNFTGWLNGDIFVLNDGNLGFPYYEYTNNVLELRGKLQGGTGPIVDKILPKEEAELNAASNSSLSAKQGYVLQTRIDKVNNNFVINTKYKIQTNNTNNSITLVPNNSLDKYIQYNVVLNPKTTEEMYQANFAVYPYDYENEENNYIYRTVFDDTSYKVSPVWKINNGWKYYIIVDKEGRICFACYQPAAYNSVLKENDSLIPQVGKFNSYARDSYYNNNLNPCWNFYSPIGNAVYRNLVIPEGGFLFIANKGDSNYEPHNVFLENLNNFISYITNGSVTTPSTSALNKADLFPENWKLYTNNKVIKIYEEFEEIKIKLYIHNMTCLCNYGRLFLTIPSFSSEKFTIQDFLSYFPDDGSKISINGFYYYEDNLTIQYPIHFAEKHTNSGKFYFKVSVFDGENLVVEDLLPDESGVFSDIVI